MFTLAACLRPIQAAPQGVLLGLPTVVASQLLATSSSSKARRRIRGVQHDQLWRISEDRPVYVIPEDTLLTFKDSTTVLEGTSNHRSDFVQALVAFPGLTAQEY